MEKVNLTKIFFAFCNNLRIKYEQLFEAYNGGQCGMVLIKHLTKGDRDLGAQHYTILTKVCI
jgi:hypothetical protein